MSFERKLNLNKNIISFIFTSFFSLFIFFSNESVYVSKVESFFLDTYAYISYPKKWYQDIFTIKEENALLSQKIVQLSLLNSELNNYKYENEIDLILIAIPNLKKNKLNHIVQKMQN